jgi:hypothetical protein
VIYLSNFRTAGKDERAISIAAITPKWYKGAVRKDLAPKLSTLTKYKKGEITMAEYSFEYVDMIYTYDLDKLAEELDNHVLLCYCSKNEFCHRLLLGLYLHKETGIEVEEIGGFGNVFTKPFNEVTLPVDYTTSFEELDANGLTDWNVNSLVGHWQELKKLGEIHLFKVA